MPLTPPGIAAAVSTAMAGVGMTGTAVPQLAFAVGTGVTLWTSSTLIVTTVDVGTLGVGAGLLPCAIPAPLLLAGFSAGLPASGIVGVGAPQLAAALANGLSLAFLQGLITTVNPTVGVGTGVATFPGPSSIPSMLAGFASAGLTGTSTAQLATGIGMGLDIAFASFTIPIPIVGAPSPLPSGGIGTGKIV